VDHSRHYIIERGGVPAAVVQTTAKYLHPDAGCLFGIYSAMPHNRLVSE
jgi:hypothetical protein